ncbi:Hypothetical protein, partial CDS, partial [Neorhizobium galegae bv. orientalis]
MMSLTPRATRRATMSDFSVDLLGIWPAL